MGWAFKETNTLSWCCIKLGHTLPQHLIWPPGAYILDDMELKILLWLLIIANKLSPAVQSLKENKKC
jgi:hypothetical protein